MWKTRPSSSGIVSALIALFLLAACQEEREAPAGTGNTAERTEPAPRAEAAVALENVDLELIAADVRPGDDFFRHANGVWLDTYELPPDKVGFGSFMELREVNQERVQALIEELAGAEPPAGSIEQKIGDYYASFLNVDRLNTLGLTPLEPVLEAIQAVDSLDALVAVFGRSSVHASNSPFGVGIEIDRKDPDRFIAGIGAAGLGLPERDYYLEDSERFSGIRDAYREHIARMLGIAGHPEPEARAAEVLALETEIARIHWPRADRRDRDLTYNLTTPAGLEKDHPDFPWMALLEAEGVVPPVINVRHPSAMGPLADLVKATPLPVWKAYLTHHAVSNNAPFLAESIDRANFEFRGKVLVGLEEQQERWRRAVNLVSGPSGLGDAIGEVYVERYFPPESRAAMQDLVEHLRTALAERIEGLDWMGRETKQRAFEKLAAFLPNIGYPDEWRDFSSVSINREDLMGNVMGLRRYFEADAIRRLSEPTDRHEWFVPAHTVNAFYNPQFNAITFPAGILEPPFFNPAADPAVNYGAIGAVIGHEMGHGFDDQGAKSDARGVQHNWWTDEDRRRFEEKAARLAEQYSAYEAVPGTFIDGRFTLGENIGDLGGVNIAYHAYRSSLGGQEAPVMDGLTGDQRFFLAYAQLWRAKFREEVVVARLKADPHSPSEYRTNGVVRNVDAWYGAFDVGEDAELYLPPEERISIW